MTILGRGTKALSERAEKAPFATPVWLNLGPISNAPNGQADPTRFTFVETHERSRNEAAGERVRLGKPMF